MRKNAASTVISQRVVGIVVLAAALLGVAVQISAPGADLHLAADTAATGTTTPATGATTPPNGTTGWE
ncbi:hypothetical protein [Kitasatospora sp. MAP5-34]|uniref:hypothetical protein n=1 Tax=Kitasatospora sp. MAP5-34 TaxID=3035102 RepID=UPI002475EC51|nr:hypothetical protein [Kitasatospora sp. MAP5-34]MDH6580228.1 hypothetical protein [Kitasatospora sp. MAP5-34]